MPRLPRLRVIPFLGLAVVHRPSALGVAWSTWSKNGFHRTWTVRGEADSWVHSRSKEVADEPPDEEIKAEADVAGDSSG